MSGQRVNLSAKYPPEPGEEAGTYAARLISHAREAGTFRQCSIGWHNECSDPYGDECMCSCHALGITLTRDQLESWAQRELTDEEVEELDTAIPNSSIPEAIGTLAANLNSQN